MKTFQEYVQLKEYDEDSIESEKDTSLNSQDSMDHSLSGAIEAFKIVLTKRKEHALNFLNKMSESMPEVRSVLGQHRLDNTDNLNSKKNSSKIISKGLGNVSPEDLLGGDDVVAANIADTFHNPLG